MSCITDLVQGDYIPHVCLFQWRTNVWYISTRYNFKQQNANIFKLGTLCIIYYIMHYIVVSCT